jgi:hypothetical protein
MLIDLHTAFSLHHEEKEERSFQLVGGTGVGRSCGTIFIADVMFGYCLLCSL